MPPHILTYLPSSITPAQVTACLGLISDTHVPAYSTALPVTLPEIFRGVDLILHAGDVGELRILDELTAIAPVVAVCGNDEASVETKRHLPTQQIIPVAGQRLLLHHSHFEDHTEEMETRREDAWQPKLSRRAAMGQAVGASIVVFGHTHIPLVCEWEGVYLVNPGATASGTPLSRQLTKTVALLYLLEDAPPLAVHVDTAAPDCPFPVSFDLAAGFQATMRMYSASLIDPTLEPDFPPFKDYILSLMGPPPHTPEFHALVQALLRISHRCWAGKQEYITRADLLRMLAEAEVLACVPNEVLTHLGSLLK